MLSTPTNHTAKRILFFFFKNGTSKRTDLYPRRYGVLCFASLHRVSEALAVRNTSRANGGVFHFRYYYVWVAWRSLELGSHLVPPATCLLALCSGPPSPTLKTPRKNIHRHHRNMDMTYSFTLVQSVLFNKIKIKNNWKIIMPTPNIRPSHTFLWLIGNKPQSTHRMLLKCRREA